jgi:hypothetical protein
MFCTGFANSATPRKGRLCLFFAIVSFILFVFLFKKHPQLLLLSVEIAGINLPPEYIDPETGRCCVLLGHLGDPAIPRGFNVTVPHQNQWILQSVLFVPAKLLTFPQCQMIRKEGAGTHTHTHTFIYLF